MKTVVQAIVKDSNNPANIRMPIFNIVPTELLTTGFLFD